VRLLDECGHASLGLPPQTTCGSENFAAGPPLDTVNSRVAHRALGNVDPPIQVSCEVD